MDRRSKFLVLAVFLTVSISSSRALPFLNPWGADLHNLVIYHRCSQDRSPYTIGGRACGDLWGRDMFYPPLLYHSYFWARPFSLETAVQIWTAFQLIAFAAVLYVWSRKVVSRARGDDEWQVFVFGALLLAQYPFVFALERGCSDVLAVVLVTVATLLLRYKWFALAGVAVGLATAYKLYPLFVCVVISCGLALHDLFGRERRRQFDFLWFGGAALLAFVLVNLVFYRDSLIYFSTVLPQFSAIPQRPSELSHSISAFAHGYPNFVRVLFGCIMAIWIWAGRRSLERGEVAAMAAGALALSTYLQNTSYDYNLVTTYPLLMLAFLRAREDNSWFWVLLLGLVAIVGERQIYLAPHALFFTPALHVGLQLAFLVTSAILVATRPESAACAGYSRRPPQNA